jgi:hypothetical protein
VNIKIRGAAVAAVIAAAAAIGGASSASASAYTHAQPAAGPAAATAINGYPVSSAPPAIQEELAAASSVAPPDSLGSCSGNPNWVHLWFNKASALNCVGFKGWTFVNDNNTQYLCAGNNSGLVEFHREGDTNPSDAQYAQYDQGTTYNFSKYGNYVLVEEVYIQNWSGGDTSGALP